MLLRFVAYDPGRLSLIAHPEAEWTDGEAAEGSPCQSGGVVKYLRGGPEVVVFDGSGNTHGTRELQDVESSSKEHDPTICFLFCDVALANEETSYTIEIAGLNSRAHMHEEKAE